MDVYPARRTCSTNAAQSGAQIMNLPNKDFGELLRQRPEELTDSAYNLFKMIGSACNACICKICEYLKGQAVPTSAIRCDCKPCNCKYCTGSVVESANIELRLRYKNKFRNELDRVKVKSIGRPYGNVICCQDHIRSCSYMPSQWKECKLKTFQKSTLIVAPMEESRPRLPERCRCALCSCDHCTQRVLNMLCHQTHEVSTGINRTTNCQCENCVDNSFQSNSTDACKCSSRRGVFRKPTEKYDQDYDIHSATVENQPLIIERKRSDRYNSMTFSNKMPCISAICQCGSKNAFNSQLGQYETLRPHNLCSTGSRLCRCTQCECLVCYDPTHRLQTESMKSLKTCVICNHTGKKWKSTSNERGRVIQVSKRGSIRVVVDPDKESNHGKKISHGLKTFPDTQIKPCRCTHYDNFQHKTYFKEMLDNVYSDQMEDHEKNSNKTFTTDLNRIPSGQMQQSNIQVYAMVNNETNTETSLANKCTETDNYCNDVKKNAENKIKNYEYTLRIEIQTPDLKEVKEATKQKIKQDTKRGVEEQTRRVVRELFGDISKNTLFNENSSENQQASAATANEERIKNMKSSKQTNVRSILKPNISSLKTAEAPSSKIQSGSTTELPAPRQSKSTTPDDCYFVRCLSTLQRQRTMNQMTDNAFEVNKTNRPVKDSNMMSLTSVLRQCGISMQNMQNEWTQIFPAATQAMTFTPLNSMEKLNSSSKVEAIDVDVKDLDQLRVQEPCVRRVSDHTVSIKWKLPKAIEDVMGYEIIVDGRTIETIYNPTRCLAVVSRLPPVGRILITIRTLTKSPGLPGLFPCTTIGYRPKANKTICM